MLAGMNHDHVDLYCHAQRPISSPHATRHVVLLWCAVPVTTGVDIFAPGSDILSAYKGGVADINDATVVLSGTSMATPHTAGDRADRRSALWLTACDEQMNCMTVCCHM